MIPFLITAFVIVGTPGPATISAAGVAKGFGFWPAMRYQAGLLTGGSATHFVIWAVISGGFLSLVAMLGPRALEWATLGLGLVSVCLLLWVAWKIGTANSELRVDAADSAPGFWQGVMLNLVNPKVYIGMTPLYYGPGYQLGWDNLPLEFGFKFVAILFLAFVGHTAWVWLGATLNEIRMSPQQSRAMNIFFGVVLAGVTFWVGLAMIAGGQDG